MQPSYKVKVDSSDVVDMRVDKIVQLQECGMFKYLRL